MRTLGSSEFPVVKDKSSPFYPTADWSKHIPALDGLRGIAILMVLMRHSIFGMETNSHLLRRLLNAGQITWSGVDLFFVLSGFLIGGILLDAKSSPSFFRTFYIRRAYRIFPIYFLVLSLFLFRHLPFRLLPGLFGDHSALSIPWGAYITLSQNLWMAHIGWFGPPAMSITWSLSVEEQFYLTIPFLIRYLPRRRLVYVAVFTTAAAPLLRTWIQQHFAHGNFSCYVLMPCRADALCMGVLCAFFVRYPPAWLSLSRKRVWLRAGLVVLASGMTYLIWRKYNEFTPPMNTFGFSWIALFYSFCLLAVVSSDGGIVHRLLRNRRLMGLGTIAYCTYLIHLPVILGTRRLIRIALHTSESGSWLPGGIVGIFATLILASISWKFFEKPLVRIGHRYTYRREA